jgi:hypothetical protein
MGAGSGTFVSDTSGGSSVYLSSLRVEASPVRDNDAMSEEQKTEETQTIEQDDELHVGYKRRSRERRSPRTAARYLSP